MSDYHEHEPDDVLERFLDGVMAGDELKEFQKRLDADKSLRAIVEQHRSVEELLRSAVVPSDTTAEAIESLLQNPTVGPGSNCPAPNKRANRRRLLIGLMTAVAAAAAWAMVFMQPRGPKQVAAFFEQRPLVELYLESVEQGFRPYYFCEDQERFARTFRKRQATPLVLAPTPGDRRMVGLSYIGGLSRDTTAMLAYVDELPVVVFVDRKEFDNESVVSTLPVPKPALHIHRSELGQLVIYEVSPFDSAKMTPYLLLESK